MDCQRQSTFPPKGKAECKAFGSFLFRKNFGHLSIIIYQHMSFSDYSQAFRPVLREHPVLGHYNEIITRPSRATRDEEYIHQIIIIDSRDRDLSLYPDPSNFVISLPSPIRDVVSMELLNISLPKSQTNITASNNTIQFQESQQDIDDGVFRTASIPNRQYPDIASVMTAVGSAMTSSSTNGVTYSLTSDPSTNRVSINSSGASGPFQLYSSGTTYQSGSILRNLGFPFNPPAVQIGSPSSGSYSYNLSDTNYVCMHLNNISNNIGSNDPLTGSFAQITMSDVMYGSYCHLRGADFGRCHVRLNPLIPTLSKVHVRFTNRDGSYYDMNNLDNDFSIEVKSKFATRDY